MEGIGEASRSIERSAHLICRKEPNLMGGLVATTPLDPSRTSLSRCRVRPEHANVQRQDGRQGLSRVSEHPDFTIAVSVSGAPTKGCCGHTLQWLQEVGGFVWAVTRAHPKDSLEKPQSCMSSFDLNSKGGKRNPYRFTSPSVALGVQGNHMRGNHSAPAGR
jgi:hypothetical protein